MNPTEVFYTFFKTSTSINLRVWPYALFQPFLSNSWLALSNCIALISAQYGLDVTVCESHTIPGGCAHSFERDGYKFDSGPSIFSGFTGPVPNPLKQVRSLSLGFPGITFEASAVLHDLFNSVVFLSFLFFVLIVFVWVLFLLFVCLCVCVLPSNSPCNGWRKLNTVCRSPMFAFPLNTFSLRPAPFTTIGLETPPGVLI